jgi:hypothetical protein
LGATTITVTCNVVDDLGQTAQSNTQVTLTVPPTPTVAETQDLCHIGFERDHRRPLRVDNEAKGCLDDIALTMQQQAGAKLVMVGNSSANEHPEAGAERALNARQYLVQEKGIDSSRIELRVGSTPGRFVSNTLVPPGAHFDGSNSRSFDEDSIVRHGQAYGTAHGGIRLGPQYRPHRSTPLHRPRSAAKGAGVTPPSGSSNGPGPSNSAPSTNTKPGKHAKPSPATPMPPQAIQAKPGNGKPSAAIAPPTKPSKPAPAKAKQTSTQMNPTKSSPATQSTSKPSKPSPSTPVQAKNGKPSPAVPLEQTKKS